MENLPSNPQQNQLVSFSGKMQLALQGKRVNECSVEEIKQGLRYGLMILGITGDKLGDDLSKEVLIQYLQKTFPNIRLDEIKLAFDFAVEKRTSPNLTLYAGEFVSARFVSEIITAYIDLKKTAKLKIVSTPSVNMNNTQRVAAILDHLTPETMQKVSDIGKEKEKAAERPKLPFYDVHQKWFKQFDQLYNNPKFRYSVDHEGKEVPGRWIFRYGFIMNVEDYFNKKVDQLSKAKKRNEYNNPIKIENT